MKTNFSVKRIYFLVLIISVIGAFCFHINAEPTDTSDNLSNADLSTAKNLFYQGRRMFFNSEADISEVQRLLDESNMAFFCQADGNEKYYWLGMVAYLKGDMAAGQNNKKEAENSYALAGDMAKKALNYNDKSSSAYRLLAASYMKLMNFKGLLYQMNHGLDSLKLVRTAISLDNSNYAAYNNLGTYYVCAPMTGGGDKNKAVKTFEKALEGGDEFDNFFSYTWLGITYIKLHQKDQAVASFQKALEIFPNSPWVKGLLREAEGGK